LYSLKEDLGSVSHENYIYTVSTSTGQKRKKYIQYIVIFVEELVIFPVTKNYQVDFEAAVISAINKASPNSVMAGCNLNFKQFL